MSSKIKIEEILSTDNLEKKYSLAYDFLCDYIDHDMKVNNHCQFDGDTCIANRLKKSVHKEYGCCYQFRKGLCSRLKNKDCTTRNISCKLFMCEYLEKKGIKYNLKDILPIKKIFNRKQINILKGNYFKTKEEIINKLLENK